MVIWLSRFLIGEAEPLARGMKRFKVGPLSTLMFFTNKFSFSTLKLCLAFATADFKSFCSGIAGLRARKPKTASASAAGLPLIKFATVLTFRGDILKYFKCAFISIILLFFGWLVRSEERRVGKECRSR